MLELRLQGDEAEARAFLAALEAGGAEVSIGGVRDRGDFSHVYAVVRMPGYAPAPAPAAGPGPGDGPVREASIAGRPIAGRPGRAVRRRR